MSRYEQHREFLKANFDILDQVQTDRQKGLPAYPFQKEYDEKATLIVLPEVGPNFIKQNNLFKCLEERRSVRKYTEQNISMEELSYLLWAKFCFKKCCSFCLELHSLSSGA